MPDTSETARLVSDLYDTLRGARDTRVVSNFRQIYQTNTEIISKINLMRILIELLLMNKVRHRLWVVGSDLSTMAAHSLFDIFNVSRNLGLAYNWRYYQNHEECVCNSNKECTDLYKYMHPCIASFICRARFDQDGVTKLNGNYSIAGNTK